MEDELKKRIVGQDEAVTAVSRPCAATAPGCAIRKRPIGSFIFLGPTGVGKTELARGARRVPVRRRDALIRIDM